MAVLGDDPGALQLALLGRRSSDGAQHPVVVDHVVAGPVLAHTPYDVAGRALLPGTGGGLLGGPRASIAAQHLRAGAVDDLVRTVATALALCLQPHATSGAYAHPHSFFFTDGV